MNAIAVTLRFWEADPSRTSSALDKLARFVDEAIQYDSVHVGVNADADASQALEFIKARWPSVDVIPITPWQKFVAPCNALMYRAARTGARVLLSASTEFPLKREFVDVLLKHLDSDTLFVGARFPEHVFEPGEHVATGANFPWGTFGAWNLRELQYLGMPLVGDAPFAPDMAGVEEVATVAVFQALASHRNFPAHAKLISIPNFYQEWNTPHWNEERTNRHRKKIRTKAERPSYQLEQARLSPPTVIHI